MPEPSTTPVDLTEAQRALAAALYRLEWDADLYATPPGPFTAVYEARARRLEPFLAERLTATREEIAAAFCSESHRLLWPISNADRLGVETRFCGECWTKAHTLFPAATGSTAGSVRLDLAPRDARFLIEHLRFLADREPATEADHAAANLSVRWLADEIEARTPTPARGDDDA